MGYSGEVSSMSVARSLAPLRIKNVGLGMPSDSDAGFGTASHRAVVYSARATTFSQDGGVDCEKHETPTWQQVSATAECRAGATNIVSWMSALQPPHQPTHLQ